MDGKNDQIIIYNTEDGQTKVEVKMQDETVWLSQKQMAELFNKDVKTVNEHIGNIYDEAELSKNSTIRKFRIVQKEGNRSVSRDIEFYNLDVIISVGYRVKSHRGTQFRIWATQKLRDYIIKGFAMDDERLSAGRIKKSFFEEWEERIRRIRTSEANFYQKVRDVFATSADYDPKLDYDPCYFML
ncbi:MAG: RhuM family protein [Candidatus Falkowbacteria bacterium]